MNTEKTKKKNTWVTHIFDTEPPQLTKFDLDPVTDIPIRMAVEKGFIKQYRELALYKLDHEWQEYPQNSIVIAGPIEEGKEFAIWIPADEEEAEKKSQKKKPKQEDSPENETQAQAEEENREENHEDSTGEENQISQPPTEKSDL